MSDFEIVQMRAASIVQSETTLMFNGYEEEVASLYEGMDLSEYY